MSDPQKLIQDCLKHKRKAQKELYETFAPDMLGVCYRYTKNIHDAEDVLQEGFIKVFKYLKKYRGEGELGAWIRKIMVNTSLTYLRKHQRYKQDMVFEEHQLPPLESMGHLEAVMAAQDIAKYIRQLPIGYQTIFNLYAVEGYSHVEIAKLLEIKEGTSRSQYARARKMLIMKINRIAQEEKGGKHV